MSDVDKALDHEAAAIQRRYRVDRDAAIAALREAMRAPGMAAAVEAEVARGKARGVAVRRLAKEARRQIYHDLRRYTADPAEQQSLSDDLAAAVAMGDGDAVQATAARLLETHASTRERLASYPTFFATVALHAANAGSVIDLGAGLHPLARPPADLAPDVYVAIDRDERAMSILDAFSAWPAPTRLIPVRAELDDVSWDDVADSAGVETFDLAYLLKLIPVLRRQQPGTLEHVARVPAHTLVVTGSREALTRRQDISRREDQVLQRFIESLSPSAVERAETGDEILYVVRR